MANINVSYEELQSTSAAINAGRDEIFSNLDKLKARMDNLITSGFVTDRSSVAIGEAYEQFTLGARNTIQGLDQVVAFLNKAEQTLREVDLQLASTLSN
ncbi:MAG: WXG100 family type VII secretion target [Bifidobacteriaceae bacterium]|jgi:uncharacterized protein YukE|nr:WXG100 family type VII secretion target [Bifidobacteriaceae bacterium]